MMCVTHISAVRSIDTYSEFERAISNDMVIAHVYYKGQEEERDPEFKAGYNFASDVFGDLQKEFAHIVSFVKINVERGHLASLGKRYSDGDYPMFVLFRFGEEVARVHISYSKMSKKKLIDFLYDHFEKLIKKKARRLEQEAEERRENSAGVSLSFGFYGGCYPYGYCYPYDYSPYYYPYGWSYPGSYYHYTPVYRGHRRRAGYRRAHGYRR